MDELVEQTNNLTIDERERAFNPLFTQLLSPDLIDKIVTEDVLKKGLFGKTNNEIRHIKEQTRVRAEIDFINDTEQADNIPEYDHRSYHYAVAVRDQNYERAQAKIRLYNKMLRPISQMGY
tara:strand:+ start:179 stop:541 length:363 start_codon:yes stop_codon:yes gene_type:complete